LGGLRLSRNSGKGNKDEIGGGAGRVKRFRVGDKTKVERNKVRRKGATKKT